MSGLGGDEGKPTRFPYIGPVSPFAAVCHILHTRSGLPGNKETALTWRKLYSDT